MTNGKMVAEDHKLTYDLKAPARSSVLKGALKCKLTTKEDFEYKTSIQNGEADVLAMDVKGPFVRKRRDVVLQVKRRYRTAGSGTGCCNGIRTGAFRKKWK